MLATLSSTSSTTPMPFPSSSPSPRHSSTPPQLSQIGAEPHESLASQSFQHAARTTSVPSSPSSITKQANPRLLDRLARDALQPGRGEGYIKTVIILGDIADVRTPWMVDVLAGSINADYIDKLDWSFSPFLTPPA